MLAKKMRLVLILLTLLLVFSGTSFADQVNIGVYEPLTGPMAAGGQMTLEGIRLAHELYPTVLGKEVRLFVEDNKTDKAEAALTVSRLIELRNVVAIVGTYGSSLAMSGGPVAETAGVPVMGCSPTHPLVTQGNDYYFRACFIDPFQGYIMAKYAYETLGARKVAIIQDIAQDYSVGLAHFFRQAFVEFTGDPASVVGMTSYQTLDTDFTAQLTYLRGLGPEAIFAPGYYGDVALLVTQARELGLGIPFLGGDACEAPEFIEIGGAYVEGVAISTHYSADAPVTDESSKFVAAFIEKYGYSPSAFAALGYDAYRLILDAIERAGTTDSGAIRDALAETYRFEGATGYITMDEDGNAVKTGVILEVKDGEFVYAGSVEPR